MTRCFKRSIQKQVDIKIQALQGQKYIPMPILRMYTLSLDMRMEKFEKQPIRNQSSNILVFVIKCHSIAGKITKTGTQQVLFGFSHSSQKYSLTNTTDIRVRPVTPSPLPVA